ncbi:MAG: glycosyltransferase [Algoriphagus sp.]|nr:glycosyltransferase [Algoriphagus sp.]
MKIHFFVQSTHQQGTFFRFHNLALGLNQMGHQVIIFASDNEPKSKRRQELIDGIQYEVWPGHRGQGIFGQWNHPFTVFDRAYNTYPEADVVHLFQPFLSGGLAWRRMKSKTKLLVYDWDDLWTGGLYSGVGKSFRGRWDQFWVNYIENEYPKKADLVTTCSDFLKDRAIQSGAKHVELLFNGLWAYQPTEKSIARKNLGLDGQARYIGFMGRTTGELEWCYQALSELREVENLRIALCGMPKEILPDVPPWLAKKVDYLGILPPIKTRDFAAALDLGLLPLEDNLFNQSRFPIKYAEYMAAGTPVIVSEVGQCAKLSSEMPWVIKAGLGKDAFIEAIKKWIQLPDRTNILDIDQVNNRFSWQRISEQLSELYLTKIKEKN